MNSPIYKGIAVLGAVLLLHACRKENHSFDAENMSPLSIEFDNIAGDQNLHLHTGNYQNTAGESFTITLLQYYVSNIQLQKADGSVFTIPQDSSYFLLKESDPSSQRVKINVPEGEYIALDFVLGVDSLRSTMDLSKRTGVLDPAGGDGNDMYQGPDSGYIFFKMEGISPQAPLDPSGQRIFRYHIGGSGGYGSPTINNLKKIHIDLRAGGTPKVKQGRSPNIHLMADIARVFNGNTVVRIADYPSVIFSTFSTEIANNYSSMFRHAHTEN